jgi:KDO2-lipid IV(A) lauroyltransferase
MGRFMKQRNAIFDWIVYVLVRTAAMIFHMFGVNANLATARGMGWCWYHLMPRHRIRARDHLRIAFGAALPEKQVDRLVLGSMQQMAMMAMELLFTPRLINPWTWPRYVWPGDLRAALDVLLDRRGAILLTGHYGNWELTGYLLATWGFDVVAVMRPLDNPYLNRYIMAMREKRGLRLLFKKGAIQSADEVLEGGGILAFIADQNAGRKGLFVDFFGRPASTYKSIGLLAMRHRVPIVVGGARRRSLRFEYDIIAPRVILPEEWEQQADPLRYITQEYTRAFEAIVREAPEQYLWIHRRWKSQPR